MVLVSVEVIQFAESFISGGSSISALRGRIWYRLA